MKLNIFRKNWCVIFLTVFLSIMFYPSGKAFCQDYVQFKTSFQVVGYCDYHTDPLESEMSAIMHGLEHLLHVMGLREDIVRKQSPAGEQSPVAVAVESFSKYISTMPYTFSNGLGICVTKRSVKAVGGADGDVVTKTVTKKRHRIIFPPKGRYSSYKEIVYAYVATSVIRQSIVEQSSVEGGFNQEITKEKINAVTTLLREIGVEVKIDIRRIAVSGGIKGEILSSEEVTKVSAKIVAPKTYIKKN